MTDDEDFYFLIETKVGESNKVRQNLIGQYKLLKDCFEKEKVKKSKFGFKKPPKKK